MSVPLSPEPPDDAVADLSSEEVVRELVLKAMSGDKSAAYELLGPQAPVETWVKVVRQLARDASAVDLEVLAHRTLRRPPAVVSAVLELWTKLAELEAPSGVEVRRELVAGGIIRVMPCAGDNG